MATPADLSRLEREDCSVSTASRHRISALRMTLVVAGIALPSLSLIPLGGFYLWQSGWLLWWAISALVLAATATLVLNVLLRREATATPDGIGPPADQISISPPAAEWTALEQQAWCEVERIAAAVELDRLVDANAYGVLARTTVSAVARRLHPERRHAELEFTLPQLMAISERVSRRLGTFIARTLPFSDRITAAQFWRLYQLRTLGPVVGRAYDIWRLIRLANPATAAANEARDRLSRAMYAWGREQIARRIATAFVEEVGRAAIDLYGGRLRAARGSSVSPAG